MIFYAKQKEQRKIKNPHSQEKKIRLFFNFIFVKSIFVLFIMKCLPFNQKERRKEILLKKKNILQRHFSQTSTVPRRDQESQFWRWQAIKKKKKRKERNKTFENNPTVFDPNRKLINWNLSFLWRRGTRIRRPMDCIRVNSNSPFCHILLMLFNNFWGDRDDVLSFPIFDEIELLECTNDIFCFNRSHFTVFFGGEKKS